MEPRKILSLVGIICLVICISDCIYQYSKLHSDIINASKTSGKNVSASLNLVVVKGGVIIDNSPAVPIDIAMLLPIVPMLIGAFLQAPY